MPPFCINLLPTSITLPPPPRKSVTGEDEPSRGRLTQGTSTRRDLCPRFGRECHKGDGGATINGGHGASHRVENLVLSLCIPFCCGELGRDHVWCDLDGDIGGWKGLCLRNFPTSSINGGSTITVHMLDKSSKLDRSRPEATGQNLCRLSDLCFRRPAATHSGMQLMVEATRGRPPVRYSPPVPVSS